MNVCTCTSVIFYCWERVTWKLIICTGVYMYICMSLYWKCKCLDKVVLCTCILSSPEMYWVLEYVKCRHWYKYFKMYWTTSKILRFVKYKYKLFKVQLHSFFIHTLVHVSIQLNILLFIYPIHFISHSLIHPPII